MALCFHRRFRSESRVVHTAIVLLLIIWKLVRYSNGASFDCMTGPIGTVDWI
jgi:hypothetical protein